MNKEYNIVRRNINVFPADEQFYMDNFNNKLNLLRVDGWQQFGEPTLNEDHTILTLIMWREVSNTNGPYR